MGHEDERVLVAPLLVALLVELAELAVLTRLGHGGGVGRFGGEDVGQLGPQSVPVGRELADRQGLDATRAQPQVHEARPHARRRLDGVGVEAELEHVPRLGLDAGQLGVDRFVGDDAGVGVVDADQEVGDAADPVVDERHLVDHVVPFVEGIAHPFDPGGERLARLSIGDAEDRPALPFVLGQAVGLVLEALVEQELGQLAERSVRGSTSPVLDPVLERQVVRAVEPGRDLGRGEKAVRHRANSTRRP